MKGMDRRLGRIEAREASRPQSLPAVDRESLRMKVRFMAALAAQGPKESPAEAISRLLEYDTPCQMTDAMRHDRKGFQERWGKALPGLA